jgi:mRNA interferase RelE/StbE
MYNIEYAERVEGSMAKFPKHDKKAIFDKIDSLTTDPRPPGVEPLHGELKGLYRVRIGNYRVIYAINDNKLLILIIKIAKRGDVYKKT